MVFVADDLGAWLVGLLADASRKKLTMLVLGSDQERELRRAASAAVQATAADVSRSGEHAGQLAMVISEVFREPLPAVTLDGPVTVLEGLQAGMAAQLAVLDDADRTGTGQSSSDVLGVTGAMLARKLAGHLVREITLRGSGGGSLQPLADQLNHDLTHRMLAELAGGHYEPPAWQSGSASPGQIMMIVKTALEGVAGLGLAIIPAADASRHRGALDKLFADLEAVHSDYLVMFEAILNGVPDAWEEGTPHFSEKVRATASALRQLRLTYEPVRVRVRAVAETFNGARLPTAERAFIEAVLAYFPTGELRGEDLTQQVRTSGTVVLDHLYRSLDGELGLDLASLVRETLRFHRQRWPAVCLTHAALQLSEEPE